MWSKPHGQVAVAKQRGKGEGSIYFGADRLDHGCAVTAQRAQGATVDVAHRFEDGRGRELAYDSMSRARRRSTVLVVADDLDQAVEDLQRD